MSKAIRTKASSMTTGVDQFEEIEERATDVDRLAFELYRAATRGRPPVTTGLGRFLTDPRHGENRAAITESRAFYRRLAKRSLEWPVEPTCLKCGCTEFNACDDGMGGGCSWSFLSKANNWGICSSCLVTLANKLR